MYRQFALIVLLAAPLAAAERHWADSLGRITALYDSGEELLIRALVTLPPWETQPYRYDISTDGARTVITIAPASGERPLPRTFRLEIPRAEFESGTALLDSSSATLGPRRAAGPAVLAANASSFLIRSERAGALEATWATPQQASFKDEWTQRGRFWVLELPVAATGLNLALRWTAKPDTSPARVNIDHTKTRFRFDGFGGNYCFNPQSPVADYTLNNLKVAWGRTEMALDEWEAENDNADSSSPNWDYFKSRDVPGSKIRAEFEMMRKLQQRGIPYAASIWWLPEWMYTDPGKQPRSQHRRKVAPTQWAEMLESIGTYLLYAKQNYGAEPDLFSFNEANIGVYVLFDPEEHREALKSIGAHLKKLGLKTKMLLADATGPNGTFTYSLAAAADPEALSYCGAVSFHSWGGAPPEMYSRWGDVAEWLGLPLLVGEVGVDAQAHRNRIYDSFEYGLREVRMYQELLTHARPQSLLYWEFTPDYSLVRQAKKPDGTVDIQPTERFAFVKHYANLTPQPADAVDARSDNTKLLVTAFKSGNVFTLHLSNHGAAREVTVEGLPAGRYQRVSTAQGSMLTAEGEVVSNGRTAQLKLPARSLTTLTTFGGPAR